MEPREYFHGGCFHEATPQLEAEKQGKGGGDHFIVEDLLDLSKEEEEDVGMADDGYDAAAGISSTDSSTVTGVDRGNNSVSGGRENHFPSEHVCGGLDDAGLSGDLCEPYDELAELEWLSNFVEESFSSEELQKQYLISGFKSAVSSATKGDDSTSASVATSGSFLPPFCLPEAPVPGKARSKRSRIPPCSWSSRLLLVSSASANSSVESDATMIQPSPGKKEAKKESTLAALAADGRNCLHCATEKTPQWRTGPMGPKTLCNACGVRYKSGRLVPEYRPAASPTFVLSKHSNSHRKVLELRRQKELQEQQQFLHAGCATVGTRFFDGSAVPTTAGDDFLIHHHLGPDFRQLI